MANSLLILNAGSSSLKFAVYRETADSLVEIFAGSIDRIGQSNSELSVKAQGGKSSIKRAVSIAKAGDGIPFILDALQHLIPDSTITAVGHRIVHGGPQFSAPQFVTAEMLESLHALSPFDPEHLPAEIDLIADVQKRFPATPQVACFDTAFHHDLPRVAQLLPIPRRFEKAGVRRYGFHGLSYEFLLGELTTLDRPGATSGRVILAHLGSGASLAAIRNGRCLDTSMGFTPTSGLVMGTRTGDLDPGLMAYLARSENLSAPQLNRMMNHDSGLRGISETSSDMRELLAQETTDVRAAEAIELFCYQAKKWLGSFAAALGGLDALVFSGGIGENNPVIRARICDGLGFLGVELDGVNNVSNQPLISTSTSRVAVRVIPTHEELMIARHVRAVIAQRPDPGKIL